MKNNVKGLERVVRIAVGATLLGQAIGGYSFFEYGMVDEIVGIFLLGTGVLASCPVKSVLGPGSKKAAAKSTAATKPAKRKPARKVAVKKPATKRKAAPKRKRASR